VKYNFVFVPPMNTGTLPIESSVTISTHGIHLGKSLRDDLSIDSSTYIRIGLDEQAKAACLVPSPQDKTAFKYNKGLGGKILPKRLISLVGEKPYVSVEGGVIILTKSKPVAEAVDGAPEMIQKQEVVPEPSKEQKKRGRPKKQQAEEEVPDSVDAKDIPPSEEFKEMCANCEYHRDIPDQPGRIKCEKHGHTKNLDYYCFKYEAQLK